MIESITRMNLDDYKDMAIILGVIVSLIVYITNSYHQYKQRTSDNAIRYLDVHSKLFKNEFLKKNIKAMEDGSFKRDASDEKSEVEFNKLLREIENLALLSENGVISKTANVYMFGWFASRIQPVLTSEERNNIYWELAVKFLDELRDESEDFYKLSKIKREEYLKKRHFFH